MKHAKQLVSVVVPVYNEQAAVLNTLNSIKKVMQPYEHEIIVVNDCSKDKTGELLASYGGITLVNNAYNLGYGASLKKGIAASKGELILIIDADGTYPVDSIPTLLRYAEQYDMVVGARTGKNVSVPLLKKVAKFFLRMFANFLVGRKIPDLNSGMRVFKRKIALEFWNLFPSRFSFTSTITLACLTNDYTVKYVPVNYYKRSGKSSIRPFDFINFLSLIFRIVLYFNPLKFFLVPSVLIFLMGALWMVYTVITQGNVTSISVIMLLTGFQIALTGVIAELIIKSRYNGQN